MIVPADMIKVTVGVDNDQGLVRALPDCGRDVCKSVSRINEERFFLSDEQIAVNIHPQQMLREAPGFAIDLSHDCLFHFILDLLSLV